MVEFKSLQKEYSQDIGLHSCHSAKPAQVAQTVPLTLRGVCGSVIFHRNIQKGIRNVVTLKKNTVCHLLVIDKYLTKNF